MIECDLHVVVSESECRSVRKSEGESKPDAHSAPAPTSPLTPQLIHTANPPSNSPPNLPPDNIIDNLPHNLPIEFHTATDICFEIYLQIICITHDIVITHSCFTTCASTSNHEVS